MFKDVLQRLGLGAVAVILAAFAGGIAFVALAYGLFALLELYLLPAGAAAITAVVFGVVAAGFAVLVPTVAPKKADVATLKPKLDQRTIALASEAGVAALGIVGDLMISRRLKRQDRARRRAPRVERVVAVERERPDPREAELRKARLREEKALMARKRAEKSRQKAEKKLRAVRLKSLKPHHH